jgi:hypothetical protein
MAGTRAKIQGQNQSGNNMRKLICCALVAAIVLGLAAFLYLDRHKVAADTAGPNEPIDFSSLAATITPLDEFGSSGNNPSVIALSFSGLSTTSGMKSNFMQTTSVSGLVLRYAGKLQRHLESGLRNVPETERNFGKPALLTASWRPAGQVVPETKIVTQRIGNRAGQ